MKGMSEEDAGSDDEEPISNAWSHYFKNALIEDITYYSNSYNTINPETGERFGDVCTIDGENCIDRVKLRKKKHNIILIRSETQTYTNSPL